MVNNDDKMDAMIQGQVNSRGCSCMSGVLKPQKTTLIEVICKGCGKKFKTNMDSEYCSACSKKHH